MAILDIVRQVVGEDLWAEVKQRGKHIYLPCPQCRQSGGDTSGDNLVITPEKNIAKCFACGYTITSRYSTLLHQSRMALQNDFVLMEYLSSRKVDKAALASGVVGALTEEVEQQFGLEQERALVFWLTDGVKIRPVPDRKPKYMMSTGARGHFEIYTGADMWMVCEGEIDALTLFDTFGKQFNYLATGGANRFPPTLANDMFFLFPDNDNAGETMVEALRQEMSFYLVRIPLMYKDVNEWRVKDDLFKVEIVKALRKAEKVLKPIPAVVRRIEEMMERSKEKARTRNRAVADFLIKELLVRGRFILSEDGTLFYFYEATKQIYPVHQKNTEFQALMTMFGIYSNEQVFTYIVDTIQSKVRMDTLYTKTKILHNSWFDWDKKELYIDLKNGEYLVLDGEKVEKREYGDGDVLFWGWGQERVIEETEEDALMQLLDMFPIKSEIQKQILYTWIIGVVFNGLFYSRPLLVLESVAGSGKTTLAKTIGKVLIDPDFDVSAAPENADNFMAIVSRNSLIVFDNVEKMNKEIYDLIAMAATGATFQKRKLYHEFETVRARAVAWVCFTMMNNTLKRKDIIERTLFVNLQRLQKFLPVRSIFEKVSPAKVWGSILDVAQKILRHIREHGFEPIHDVVSQIRMADFAVFLDIVCTIKGWNVDEIVAWWLRTSAAYALADNLYLDVLLQAYDDAQLWGRYVTASEIVDAMHQVVRSSSTINKTEREIILALRPKAFLAWLENQKGNLELVGYSVEIMTEYAKKAKKIKIIRTEDAPTDLLMFGELEQQEVPDDTPPF